jgi:hypothetical protein
MAVAAESRVDAALISDARTAFRRAIEIAGSQQAKSWEGLAIESLKRLSEDDAFRNKNLEFREGY